LWCLPNDWGQLSHVLVVSYFLQIVYFIKPLLIRLHRLLIKKQIISAHSVTNWRLVPNMFVPTRTCWNYLQKALKIHSTNKSVHYIVKIDVAIFFGSLNQHTLVNLLSDYKYPKLLASRLELILTAFTGQRSSRGILQGIFPSDLFGTFYMTPIDRFLKEYGVASARYVDDIYVFIENVDAAEALTRELIPFLRSYDLVLNESKCVVIPKGNLITEEPDLEGLFNKAISEVSKQIKEDEFDVDYGFQSEWKEEDESDDADKWLMIQLKATETLFSSIENYPNQEDNIERFCLPLFGKAGSAYAVEHVLDSFKSRPAMAQIYVSYLAKFMAQDKVRQFLVGLWKIFRLQTGKSYGYWLLFFRATSRRSTSHGSHEDTQRRQ